jgi:hypothetical protein
MQSLPKKAFRYLPLSRVLKYNYSLNGDITKSEARCIFMPGLHIIKISIRILKTLLHI